jgi:hypothetical protein
VAGSGERQTDVGIFPTLAHAHQSTRAQRAVHSGARSAPARAALGSARACRHAASSLGAGVHPARPPRRACALAGKRKARREGWLTGKRDATNSARHRDAATKMKATDEHQRPVTGVGLTLALWSARPQTLTLVPCT